VSPDRRWPLRESAIRTFSSLNRSRAARTATPNSNFHGLTTTQFKVDFTYCSILGFDSVRISSSSRPSVRAQRKVFNLTFSPLGHEDGSACSTNGGSELQLGKHDKGSTDGARHSLKQPLPNKPERTPFSPYKWECSIRRLQPVRFLSILILSIPFSCTFLRKQEGKAGLPVFRSANKSVPPPDSPVSYYKARDGLI
jgi:hypothetical protein